MIIFPAIDIKDGTCVRLVKGDYATAHKVAENAVETAKILSKCRRILDTYGRFGRSKGCKACQQ